MSKFLINIYNLCYGGLAMASLEELVKELKVKEKEFELLCKKLDELKAKNINPNDPILLELKSEFLRNKKDIDRINKKLEKLNKND